MGQSVNTSGIAQAVPNTDNMDSTAGLPIRLGSLYLEKELMLHENRSNCFKSSIGDVVRKYNLSRRCVFI